MPPTTRNNRAIRLDSNEMPRKRATAIGFVRSEPSRQTVSFARQVYVSQMAGLLFLS